MAKDFKLPDLGEGVESGDVVRVMVAEGDTITAEQPVVEIETDKAVVEVPCPFAGRIVKVHVSEGSKIKVGATLVTVEESGDGQAATPARSQAKEKAKAAQKQKAPKAEPESAGEEPAEPPAEPAAAEPKKAPAPKAGPVAAEKKESKPKPADDKPSKAAETEPIPAGPATRRLARELGVELRDVASAHPGERLTEEHVKEYVKSRMTAGPSAGGAVAAPPLPDFSQWGEIERKPLSSLQRKTAENLAAAWSLTPHVTQFDEPDITTLEALRKRYREKAGPDGVKLTVTAFVVKAVAGLLKEFPQFNSSLDARTNELIFKRYCHIGIAVDTPAGLIVPVLRDADAKSVIQIAAEMEDLAERTRQRKVALEELKGGTFTITNLGGIGGTAFTPVVNYPEVAILGLARSREVPVLRNGQLASKLVLPLCLSYDHRVVNGADGARFIRRLSELLQDPEMLLLQG